MRFARAIGLLAILALPALAADGTAGETGAPSPEPEVAAETLPTTLAPLPPRAVEPVPSAGVAGAMAGLVSDPIFADALVSLQVVEAVSGQEVYAWGDDRELVPASTMKLLTAAVALRALGPQYRFPTWIRHDGTIAADGVLDGNLYVQGQGDPTMVVERMWRMVRDLRLRGIREVRGDVVFDDAYFADSVLVPGWDKPEDVEGGPTYFAPLGALSVNYNVAAMVIRPGGAVGEPASVELDTPTPAVAVANQLTTGKARSRPWIRVERAVDAESGVATFTLTGNVPVDRGPDLVYRAVADPLGNYIGAFASLAQQAGIVVKGRLRPGATPAESALFHHVESEPLADILSEMNKHSNNFMAEQILRVVGAETVGLPGTTEKGLRVVGDYLSSLGVREDRYTLVNGSGLARGLLLRPSQVNKVLADMWSDVEVGPEFVNSLSVGGRDGTLWTRFREEGMAGRVRGKTGSLTGVHCLSGYVTAADGETYAFTFLVNDIDGALARARRAHDRLVLSLAGSGVELADVGDTEAAAR